ncbi:hypothetical protein [Mycobacterium riyadhense]|uniref:hypothetical protein n=1 Tax=Mycobacterium riyadhense TaxID=486698 RepID=UPI001956AE76|nr:hypothetical protein [Mycobacterium riyadhense]
MNGVLARGFEHLNGVDAAVVGEFSCRYIDTFTAENVLGRVQYIIATYCGFGVGPSLAVQYDVGDLVDLCQQ